MNGVMRVMARINEIKSLFGPEAAPIQNASAAGLPGENNSVNGTGGAADFDKALLAAQIRNGMPPNELNELNSTFSSQGLATGMLSQNSKSSFDGIIQETATKYGVDPALVKAVMMAESGGNPNAKSSAGALGLMQLMPATARGLGVKDPFDPTQNISGGARYLKGQLDRFKDVRLALAAYNAGPGAVRKYGGVPPYKETQNYVVKVMDLYSRYKNG